MLIKQVEIQYSNEYNKEIIPALKFFLLFLFNIIEHVGVQQQGTCLYFCTKNLFVLSYLQYTPIHKHNDLSIFLNHMVAG